MQAIPGLTLARHDGPFGNALLTRRKVLAVRRLGFTYSGREPRNALDVDLEVAGETVRVIVTHLGLWPAERRFQVQADSENAEGNPDRVSASWSSATSTSGCRSAGRCAGCTRSSAARPPSARFPSRWPLVALDRVWVRPRHALLALKAHRTPLAAAGLGPSAGEGDRRDPPGGKSGRAAELRGTGSLSRSSRRRRPTLCRRRRATHRSGPWPSGLGRRELGQPFEFGLGELAVPLRSARSKRVTISP